MTQTMPLGAHFAIHGTWTNGRDIVTSLHGLVVPSGARATAVAEAATRIQTNWRTTIVPTLAQAYVYSSVHWVDLATADGATGVVSGTPLAGGGTTSTHTPPAIGPVVVKNFVGSGRSFRTGRLYLPGLGEGSVDADGIVLTASRTSIDNAFNSFLAATNLSAPAGNLNSFTLVVAHTPSIVVQETKSRRVPDPNGELVPSAITSFSTDAVIGGIKRRVRG